MEAKLSVLWVSQDAWECARQTVRVFDDFFQAAVMDIPEPAGLGRLSFGFEVMHPVFGSTRRPSGHYHKATDTFYASAGLEHSAWVGESWERRVAAVAHGMRLAIGAIRRMRIGEADRSALLEAVAVAAMKASNSAPEVLTPLGSSYFARAGGALPATEKPAAQVFKLYRGRGDALEYREAWFAEGSVVEHFGMCGNRGESIAHEAVDEREQAVIFRRLKKEAHRDGFRAIPPSRHATILVERQIRDGFGTIEDLDVRHDLELFLDDRLGWLGLGHCDGGSTGSGTMEVFCRVVRRGLAVKVIANELASSPFNDFSVRSFLAHLRR